MIGKVEKTHIPTRSYSVLSLMSYLPSRVEIETDNPSTRQRSPPSAPSFPTSSPTQRAIHRRVHSHFAPHFHPPKQLEPAHVWLPAGLQAL